MSAGRIEYLAERKPEDFRGYAGDFERVIVRAVSPRPDFFVVDKAEDFSDGDVVHRR